MQMKTLLDSPEFEFRFNCGVMQPTYGMKFEERDAIVSALCRHFTVYASIAELDQLLQGLQTLKFASLMQAYPSLLCQVFKSSKQTISADFIQDFFEVQYSPIGSNNRKVEENIIMNWINYLHDSEGMCMARSVLYIVATILNYFPQNLLRGMEWQL